jgi:MFS family permease
VLLDHYGARRVTATTLLFAAAGVWIFGAAHSLGVMMIGRLLIGIGVSVCLGAAFKAIGPHVRNRGAKSDRPGVASTWLTERRP